MRIWNGVKKLAIWAKNVAVEAAHDFWYNTAASTKWVAVAIAVFLYWL